MEAIAFLLVGGLATWRMASLLAEEDGPWGILEWLRVKMGMKFDAMSQPYGATEIAKTILCIWCSTPWIGAAWAAFWLAAPRAAFALAMPFALSAVALIVNGRGIRFRKRTS